MVFEPTANAMLPDALPDATVVPFTFMVDTVLVAVGVTVTDDVALVSDTV